MAAANPISIARFWSKIDVRGPNDCWPWKASCDRHGYGQFKAETGATPKRAHRVAYALICGEIEAGSVLRHSCHTPACCNPRHLLPGTQADNHDDRERSGRCQREGGRFAENGAA